MNKNPYKQFSKKELEKIDAATGQLYIEWNLEPIGPPELTEYYNAAINDLRNNLGLEKLEIIQPI